MLPNTYDFWVYNLVHTDQLKASSHVKSQQNTAQTEPTALLTVLLLIYPKLLLSHSISHLQSSKTKRVAGKNNTSKNTLLLSNTPFSFNYAIKCCQNTPGLHLSLLNLHFCMQFHYLFSGSFVLIQFFGPD